MSAIHDYQGISEKEKDAVTYKNGLDTVNKKSNPFLEEEAKSSNGITFLLCISVFGAICGSALVYGYNISVLNNPEILLRKYFSSVRKIRTGEEFSNRQLNWYWSCCVAALPLLAPLGSFLGSNSARKFGRKKTLLGNNVLLILSGLLQALSKPLESYEMFLLGRIIVGLQSGISLTVCPMYLSEISPKKYRGGLGSLFQWFLTLGIVMGNVCGFGNVFGNSHRWPHLFTMLLVLSVTQIIILSFCPESPKHLLIEKHNEEAAIKALMDLRGRNFPITKEISDLQKENDDIKDCVEVTYLDYFRKPELRHPLMIGCMAAATLRFAGVNALTMYSQPIINAALSSDQDSSSTIELSQRLVCGVPVVRLIMTAFSVRLVDKVGRRACQLTSIAGLCLSNLVLAFLLSDVEISGQTCSGIPLSAKGHYVAIVFIYLQTFSLSIGVNCVAWLITPELFRTNARSKAVFMATTVNSTSNFLVALGFNLIREVICGWVFLIFAFLLIIPFVYFYLELPVLDRKSINEIAAIFEERAKINRYTWMFKSCCNEKNSEEGWRLLGTSPETNESGNNKC